MTFSWPPDHRPHAPSSSPGRTPPSTAATPLPGSCSDTPLARAPPPSSPLHRPQPASGSLGDATLGEIDALVTWDGEWLAQATYAGWDERIAADPRVFDALAPWAYLPAHTDLRVVMLSETDANADFNYDRPLPDEAAMGAFFGPRDPSGLLRAQLEANGALADGVIDMLDAQQLLFSILKAQGNPVTLDVMPDTNHTTIGTAGWPVFLAAFQKAAAKD
jgi:hypothetical protein